MLMMQRGLLRRSLSLSSLASSVRSGERSAESLTARSFRGLERVEKQLNAFVSISPTALDRARSIDEKTHGTTTALLLEGVPVAIKDNLVHGGATTAGSGMNLMSDLLRGGEDAQPNRRAAWAVAALESAGCVVVGKANCDEFGMGSTGETSQAGATRNPWDPTRSPGGSSSGSAAAVASGVVPLALGSDTGGSIRQPASWCGVVGLKPTYGLLSREGLVAYCSSTDTVGPIAGGVTDVALAMHVLTSAAPSSGDATVTMRRRRPQGGAGAGGGGVVPPPERSLWSEEDDTKRQPPLRVGLVLETDVADFEVAEAVRSAAAELARAAGGEAGGALRVVSLPSLHEATVAYYVIAACEAFTNLARFHRHRGGAGDLQVSSSSSAEEPYFLRGDAFGEEVRRRLSLGASILGERHGEDLYTRATAVRARLLRELEATFEDVDALVLPAALTTARLLGTQPPPSPAAPGDSAFVRAVVPSLPAAYRDDEFTCFASLAGFPALSVPCALSAADGLPIGLQIVARPFEELTLLKLGSLHERLAGPDWRRGKLPTLHAGERWD